MSSLSEPFEGYIPEVNDYKPEPVKDCDIVHREAVKKIIAELKTLIEDNKVSCKAATHALLDMFETDEVLAQFDPLDEIVRTHQGRQEMIDYLVAPEVYEALTNEQVQIVRLSFDV